MDPVPIDNRNDSCDEILATASKLATIFKNAAGLYIDLAPTFTEFHESCMTFAESVRAIQSWLTDGPEKQLLDSAPWYQLTRSLGRAEKAINVLQDEVQTVLRSRYESRSRSRIITEWNLEGVQNYGEDVQHETQTLQQILQYMKLLLISDTTSNSTVRVEDHHAVEGLTPRRASLPAIASGSQADTVDTLDKPAPPYRLVDVRSNETHTQWYVEQSVDAVDEAAPIVPLPFKDAARLRAFREMRSLLPSLHSLHGAVTYNDPKLLACPSCGVHRKELEMFQHFKQKHHNEERVLHYILTIGRRDRHLLVFVKLSGTPSCQFQVDNRDVSFHNRWPWDTNDFEFSVHSAEDYVLGGEKAAIEELEKLLDVLYSVLRKIRPNFGWESDTSIEHTFVKIDTLWKLCMSSNALSMEFQSSSGLLEARHMQHWLSSLANALNSTANEHRLSDVVIMFNQALMFAEEVRTKYLNELNELIQCMASLNLLSAQLPFSTLILQDLPE